MTFHRPNMSGDRPVIRQLDEAAVNRIAAGEVVERPASAVKELVENALDAGARRIAVAYAGGGKTLIRVTDDGCGMTADELPLALSRHATSKLPGTDLLDIRSFGFRGEALPSLAAVARLTLTSRAAGHPGAAVTVTGGRAEAVRPAALARGTVVEIADLFCATPARLKFLRSDRAEAQAIADVVRRLALAEPMVAFDLTDLTPGGEGRCLFRHEAGQGDLFDALAARVGRVMGAEFLDNSRPIEAEREGLRLTGFAALPTYSRGAAVAQHLFVNGRPVQDRMLLGALRAGYADVLPAGRHPAAVLFLSCAPELVDVNVHPAKSEVRFRDPAVARALVVTALRHALAEAGHRASSTVGAEVIAAFRPGDDAAPRAYQGGYRMDRPSPAAVRQAYAAQAPLPDPGFAERSAPPAPQTPDAGHPLGAARAQLHGTYIVAQTATGIVLVDQHAAHERLVYERLKRQREGAGIVAQSLLIPEIVELSPIDAARAMAAAAELERLGLTIEPFGGGAIAIRAIPAILGRADPAALLSDILDELADEGETRALAARIDAVLSRMACHGSVRAGRAMRPEEMDALLREMEATPLSGQCNHGRPTYVELKLSDIERLFGRT